MFWHSVQSSPSDLCAQPGRFGPGSLGRLRGEVCSRARPMDGGGGIGTAGQAGVWTQASKTTTVCPSNIIGLVVLALSAWHVVMPSFVDEAFALVPHHTVFTPVPEIPIPFLWNVGTAHFYESQPWKAVLVIPVLVLLARLLERLWTPKAIALHVLFSVTCSGAMFFLAELIHVYRTHHEKDFFIPVRGSVGLLVSLAMGVRHAYPLEALPLLPRSWGLQCQHLPFAVTVAATGVGCVLPQLMLEWSFAPFAFFFAWLHLRYLMWFPQAQAHGDHSEDFCFAAMFPRPLRPPISCIGAVVHSLSNVVAPGFVQLRQVDMEAGNAIVYDPTSAHFGNPNVSWTPDRNLPAAAMTGDKTTQEYQNRRAKALALLDQNISKLLAPENTSRPVQLLEKSTELKVPGSPGAPSLVQASAVSAVRAESPAKSRVEARSPPKDIDL